MVKNNNKLNKRAWLKIIEAVIAILIVIGAVIYIISANAPNRDIGTNVYEKEKFILNTLNKDNNQRTKIITTNTGSNNDVNDFIKNLIPLTWNFETNICEIGEICESTMAPKDKEIYVSEVVITSDLTEYKPKKLRLFIWEK